VNNYAFIDGQNLYSGVRQLGWILDYQKFRAYLARRYDVTKAYYFLGYLPQQQTLYRVLHRAGYELVFKPVVHGPGHNPKGNVDADLVLRTMIEFPNYDQAILVTGDGDFHSLAAYLYTQGKLRMVLAPNRRFCSTLLRSAAQGQLHYVEAVRHLLERST
jgi:uncharacterized LabA/DUF88 family protein